jgi:lipooligosaccharide transport system permease protein
VPSALRVAQRNLTVYRRTWRGSLLLGFLQPTLFLFAFGWTLGAFVQRGTTLPGGLSYLQFVAPGLLAAACMQTAAFESTWPVNGKMYFRHIYDAMIATPVGGADIVGGELLWIAARLTAVATAFTAVTVAFGVAFSWEMIAAVPAAVLTGLAFAAPILGYAARRPSGDFNALYRFVLTPLFLFSGVFFPIDRLPRALRDVAWCTPLYHGAALTRGLMVGGLDSMAIVHVAYLTALALGGAFVAARTFNRHLRA